MIGYSFHPQASEDAVEIARYYEERRSGLGKDFRAELTAAISSLRQTPEAAPVIRGNTPSTSQVNRRPFRRRW